jgi:hypothetical protein
VPKEQVENGLEGSADDENGTVDELSDEEIHFSNAFDVLKGSAASAPPPVKKLKQKASLPQLVMNLYDRC